MNSEAHETNGGLLKIPKFWYLQRNEVIDFHIMFPNKLLMYQTLNRNLKDSIKFKGQVCYT